ncbi:Bug family tripartite tricarboxylate transporter substrate binding protein [Muricoccus radiodurans]|uniref:Bug family tripartite tricarboxylate transporter substrate binding protein n=1 Tax=Muricoccus radiodurans TaxID=2231721 RepID=UPI003CEF2D57
MQRRILLAAALAAPAIARAQESWPDRPVTLIVPYAPGGSNDVVARLMSPGFAETFGGKAFPVENRAGGGGAVGMAAVARGRPDGHTLLVSSASNHIFNHFVVPNQGYDPREALSAACMWVDVPNALVAHPSLGVSNVQELLAKVRANPGLGFGSSGTGTSNHLAGELLKMRTGIDMTHVPYRGGGPLLNDIVAGTVQVAVMNLPTVLPAIEGNRVRLLGLATSERLRSRPSYPTIAEQGVEGYVVRSWTGLFAPHGTPRPILDRLAETSRRLLDSANIRARLTDLASEPIWMGPDETDAYVRSEWDRWGPIVRQAGVTNT